LYKILLIILKQNVYILLDYIYIYYHKNHIIIEPYITPQKHMVLESCGLVVYCCSDVGCDREWRTNNITSLCFIQHLPEDPCERESANISDSVVYPYPLKDVS